MKTRMKIEDIQNIDIAGASIPEIAEGNAEIIGDKIEFLFRQQGADTPWSRHAIEQERE